ncbi:hypothetical protein ACIOHC_36280 [Streptomyces sp. NPDC088252]|uniref:hypothetical protein n=1 Tax=Streptomyces sp. NPDC088252 TaxID=3365845 RepID=UPI0037FEF5F8
MQVEQGGMYAFRDHHMVFLPPAQVLSTDEWYWFHDVYSRPRERYPVRLGGLPYISKELGYVRGSKPVASQYDKRGVPVVRPKLTMDPHIVKGLHAVQLFGDLTPPDLSGEDAVEALVLFEASLPPELIVDVIATEWCEYTWSDYVPRAREQWRRSPNRENYEKYMSPANRARSARFLAEA